MRNTIKAFIFLCQAAIVICGVVIIGWFETPRFLVLLAAAFLALYWLARNAFLEVVSTAKRGANQAKDGTKGKA